MIWFYPLHFSIADFSQFVTKKLWAWEQTNLSWAKNFTGDVLIVYYDNLVQFTEETLREVLNFIKYPINEVGPSFGKLLL